VPKAKKGDSASRNDVRLESAAQDLARLTHLYIWGPECPCPAQGKSADRIFTPGLSEVTPAPLDSCRSDARAAPRRAKKSGSRLPTRPEPPGRHGRGVRRLTEVPTCHREKRPPQPLFYPGISSCRKLEALRERGVLALWARRVGRSLGGDAGRRALSLRPRRERERCRGFRSLDDCPPDR